MKLCVFSPVFSSLTLEESLSYLAKKNIGHLELGVGGYPGTGHANAKELILDVAKISELVDLLKKYNITITALSVHGNALHPNSDIAKKFDEDFVAACKLGGLLGVDTIITFSGCPGDSDMSKYPNWVVCPWPEDFLTILDYQWDKMIAYWKDRSKLATANGIKKIALEMHPGFCVYNPETLLRLRKEVGDIIGANFDPSHLVWQGIDISKAIVHLGKSIYHFHAKDTAINNISCPINGVLDTKPYSNEIQRSWIFRTIGYGMGLNIWKEIISSLQLIGYNGAISIEHEDSLMTPMEGLDKAIQFLQDIIISEAKPTSIYWA